MRRITLSWCEATLGDWVLLGSFSRNNAAPCFLPGERVLRKTYDPPGFAAGSIFVLDGLWTDFSLTYSEHRLLRLLAGRDRFINSA